jgi:hypothetical protein
MRCATVAAARLCISPALPFSCSPSTPALQFLDCVHDRPPDPRAVGIACLEKLICPLGTADWRLMAVLVDQQLGPAVDIEWDYRAQCRSRT